MSGLSDFLKKRVSIITTDGCLLVGQLESYDRSTNIVLCNAEERIFDPVEPFKSRYLGTYIVRGEMITTVGLVDVKEDASIDWHAVHGDKIGTTRHRV